MTEEVRAWVYRAATAVLALAAVYGFVNAEQGAAIGNVIGALVGLLASVNTSTSKPE